MKKVAVVWTLTLIAMCILLAVSGVDATPSVSPLETPRPTPGDTPTPSSLYLPVIQNNCCATPTPAPGIRPTPEL